MTYQRKEVIGDCTLLLGDCRDILPTLGKVDAVVTDPPYGIGLANGFTGSGAFGKRREYAGSWDSESPPASVFDLIIAAGKCAVIWGGNYFTDKVPQGSFWLVWDKQNTMPSFSDCELAWTNLDKKSVKRITYLQNGGISKEKERFHPTQKPVGVMDWCLGHLPSDARTILDPFMGSGTTGVSCARQGRAFIGIEREPSYFEIACRRIEEAYKQPDMFVAAPEPKAVQPSMFDGDAA